MYLLSVMFWPHAFRGRKMYIHLRYHFGQAERFRTSSRNVVYIAAVLLGQYYAFRT